MNRPDAGHDGRSFTAARFGEWITDEECSARSRRRRPTLIGQAVQGVFHDRRAVFHCGFDFALDLIWQKVSDPNHSRFALLGLEHLGGCIIVCGLPTDC